MMHGNKSYYKISELIWWEESNTNNNHECGKYDRVIATDVLYDLSSLSCIFTTAYDLLADYGYFILSHIPRCSAHNNTTNEVICNTTYLEELIRQKAIEVGFDSDISEIRPLDICDLSRVNDYIIDNPSMPTLQEMHDVDAAVFIFRKK